MWMIGITSLRAFEEASPVPNPEPTLYLTNGASSLCANTILPKLANCSSQEALLISCASIVFCTSCWNGQITRQDEMSTHEEKNASKTGIFTSSLSTIMSDPELAPVVT